MDCRWCGADLAGLTPREWGGQSECADIGPCVNRMAKRVARKAIAIRMERKGMWIDG